MLSFIATVVVSAAAGFGAGRIKSKAKLQAIKDYVLAIESDILKGAVAVEITKILGDIKSKL